MIARRPWLGISPADDRIKSETPQSPYASCAGGPFAVWRDPDLNDVMM